jgi:hypothetical protein
MTLVGDFTRGRQKDFLCPPALRAAARPAAVVPRSRACRSPRSPPTRDRVDPECPGCRRHARATRSRSCAGTCADARGPRAAGPPDAPLCDRSIGDRLPGRRDEQRRIGRRRGPTGEVLRQRLTADPRQHDDPVLVALPAHVKRRGAWREISDPQPHDFPAAQSSIGQQTQNRPLARARLADGRLLDLAPAEYARQPPLLPWELDVRQRVVRQVSIADEPPPEAVQRYQAALDRCSTRPPARPLRTDTAARWRSIASRRRPCSSSPIVTVRVAPPRTARNHSDRPPRSAGTADAPPRSTAGISGAGR